MENNTIEVVDAKALVWNVLKASVSNSVQDQLKNIIEGFQKEESSAKFIMAFGRMNRLVERKSVTFSNDLHSEMSAFYPGFDPINWFNDQLLRIYTAMSFPNELRKDTIDQLFKVADMKEQIALYKGAYFLEDRENYIENFAEGIRTNMINVFDAIALNNPYPKTYLEEHAWNQMVLKAFFMDRPIFQICGIDERKNEKLAQILFDYAQERWAASRSVSVELWRLMSGFISEDMMLDITKAIENATELEKKAMVKAIKESDFPQGHYWLKENKIFEISDAETWDSIGVSALQIQA